LWHLRADPGTSRQGRHDLLGYPLTLIISGTAHPPINDNREFAQRLRENLPLALGSTVSLQREIVGCGF